MGALTERTLTSRLRIRLLAEHHLGLRHQRVSGYGILRCFVVKFAKFFRTFVLENIFEQLLRLGIPGKWNPGPRTFKWDPKVGPSGVTLRCMIK